MEEGISTEEEIQNRLPGGSAVSLLFESGISISVVRVWISISVKARKNPRYKSKFKARKKFTSLKDPKSKSK